MHKVHAWEHSTRTAHFSCTLPALSYKEVSRINLTRVWQVPPRFERLSMFADPDRNTLDSTLGRWFGLLAGGFAETGARRCLGTHLSPGRSLVKYNPITLARTGSFVERMKITSVPGGNKGVVSKSMSNYATQNVLPHYVQRMGNKKQWGNTQQLQTATCDFLLVD